MPQYSYKARDKDGLAVAGVIEAQDEMAVADNLYNLGYHLVQLKKQSELKKRMLSFFKKFQRVSQKEIIFFTRQLAAMLKSGLPITMVLNSIVQQIRNEYFSAAINTILKDVEDGDAFSIALSRHDKIFNDLYVNMIKVGETAGILDMVLDRLITVNTQEMEVRMRLRSALYYPAILLISSIAIVTGLLIFIIPKFVVVFEAYNAQLPFATRALLIISLIVTKLWPFCLAAAIGAYLWFQRSLKTEKGRYQFHNVLIRFPVFGDFYLKILVSRFTRILGALIKSGVPILEALQVTEKTIHNVVFSRVIQAIQKAVSDGQSLAEPIKASGIFPEIVVQMVTVGEKSGTLDKMLVDVAVYYDQETDHFLKNLTTTIEPVMLLVMGVIVAFIALSVLLPLFNIVRVFRAGI